MNRPRPGLAASALVAGILSFATACGHSPGPADPVGASPTATPAARAAVPTPSAAAATAQPAPSNAGDVGEDLSRAVGTDTGQGAPATKLLAGLTVRGRAPMTGYSREQFGQPWADIDRNGCDTRSDVLKRDLTSLVFKPGTRDCAVLTGTLRDPYTARTVTFVRGGASEVDVDHVVALGNAWASGAARLTPDTRAALANDPLNLLAVDATTNRAKGDGDAATWLPPNKAFRCSYVARQVAVKAKYSLSVTSSEHAAASALLARCVGQRAPSGGSNDVAAGFGTSPAGAPAPQPVPTGTAVPTRRPTCRQAITAGSGNFRQGIDAEYELYDDVDHDGVVCEHPCGQCRTAQQGRLTGNRMSQARKGVPAQRSSARAPCSRLHRRRTSRAALGPARAAGTSRAGRRTAGTRRRGPTTGPE